ncbi:nuclear pore complex component-domain-containing protein [Pyrenochaeta sp. MPI-SDFR-AT-0127]|nr:nuclear pore complex component-domain-containing protein [Pyrenochaeta sp. MPI-SDFR-AT-0127]
MSLARLAQPATPQTRAAAAAQPEQPYTPNGAWRHPKFDEIARRQYATTFDERNVRAIVANASLLFLSVYANAITSKVKLLDYAATPIHALVTTVPYSAWVIVLVRLAFAVNIAIAFAPLVRRYYPDDIADIALTPSQRAAMGLKQDILSPQTPGSAYASPNYVTPPRYQRSTPRSSSFSSQADHSSQSPITGSPRASLARSSSNSPFSPSTTGSPLFQKALGGGSATKRLSYGGGSPMSSSLFGDSSSSVTPGTPTPLTGKASVGLNNKWLYEKRRDSPRSNLFA